MKNIFSQKIKKLEQELVDLKTASKYTSVKSSSYVSPTQVYTGTYQINYKSGEEPIMSKVYISSGTPSWLRTLVVRAYLRTPSTDSQILEINTSVPDSGGQTPVTSNATITILSNREIASITRV